MSEEIKYAKPRMVEDPSSCFFYHVMDLPGLGLVGEHWDLRHTIDDYLGNYDFQGKRVLDVGAASGFLTFEMERRGATVVSFDLELEGSYDIVPFVHPSFDLARREEELREVADRLFNAYWYAHRVLDSKAKVFYGNIYDIPEALGPFDVVVMGAILLHLRDPFQALYQAARLSTDAVIIAQPYFDMDRAVMEFIPVMERVERFNQSVTWWRTSDKCMVNMLNVLGFPEVSITRADHMSIQEDKRLAIDFSTYAGKRSSYESR